MSSSVINKINSNNNNNSTTNSSDEESGWTAYLEDFSCSNKDDDCSFVSSSPSLVSDAAWNGISYNFSHVKRLNFKNSKKNNNNNNYSKKKYSCDDDLEDTASSPVNSPKVSSMKQMEVNYPRMDELATRNLMGKQAAGSNNFSEVGREEQNGKHIIENQYVDLKKRGLCLVPMSMLMNYIG